MRIHGRFISGTYPVPLYDVVALQHKLLQAPHALIRICKKSIRNEKVHCAGGSIAIFCKGWMQEA